MKWLQNIGFRERRAIYDHLVVPNFYSVAGYANNSFDEIRIGVLRRPEYDYVAMFRSIEEVGGFIDQDIVAFLNARQHGRAIDLETADRDVEQGEDRQRDKNGYDDVTEKSHRRIRASSWYYSIWSAFALRLAKLEAGFRVYLIIDDPAIVGRGDDKNVGCDWWDHK